MTTTLAGYFITAPGAAPTAAAGTVTGSLGSGTYGYNVTFVTPFGETNGATTPTSFGTGSNTSVNLTAIATSSNPNVYQRNLYRTAVGGSNYFFLATVAGNTTTTYTDTASDLSISGNPQIPTGNTAMTREVINGNCAFGSPVLLSVDNGVNTTVPGAQTQTQAGAYVLTKEITVIATAAANDGCILPTINANNIGMHYVVCNDSGGNFLVYPNVGQKIGSGGTLNAAVTLGTGVRAEFVAASSAGVWERTR